MAGIAEPAAHGRMRVDVDVIGDAAYLLEASLGLRDGVEQFDASSGMAPAIAALALGAQAVWIGTAFLVADEGELFDACKDQIVASDSEAFRISKIWTGKTVRAFHSEISQAWAESGLPTLETPHQRILMEDFLAAALAAGRHDLFYNIAGQAGGLVKGRRPAKDIMADLVDGAAEQLRRLQRDVVVSLP